MTPVTDFDFIFLSYDEPNADSNWLHLKTLLPNAKRVHGVRGFDAAHKACADLSSTPWLFIVDSDSRILPSFLQTTIDWETIKKSNCVLSWSAKNNVNELLYGNGGIKCWPKKLLSRIKSHEKADDPAMAIDFCYKLDYIPQQKCASTLDITGSPYQAFRSGFREGVKLSIQEGYKKYDYCWRRNKI